MYSGEIDNCQGFEPPPRARPISVNPCAGIYRELSGTVATVIAADRPEGCCFPFDQYNNDVEKMQKRKLPVINCVNIIIIIIMVYYIIIYDV